jgi:hypothetical protein
VGQAFEKFGGKGMAKSHDKNSQCDELNRGLRGRVHGDASCAMAARPSQNLLFCKIATAPTAILSSYKNP